MQNKIICNWDRAGWKNYQFRKDGIKIKNGDTVLDTHKNVWLNKENIPHIYLKTHFFGEDFSSMLILLLHQGWKMVNLFL